MKPNIPIALDIISLYNGIMSRTLRETDLGFRFNTSPGEARHDVMDALRGSGLTRRKAREIVYNATYKAKTPDEVSLCIRGLLFLVERIFG